MIAVSIRDRRRIIDLMTDTRIMNLPRRYPSINAERQCAAIDLHHLAKAANSQAALMEYIREYRKFKPISLILRSQPFCGLDIKTRPPILNPRPETEYWVSQLLETVKLSNKKILEVGTGSGCIALAIASKYSSCHFTAIDISPSAISLAEENKARLQVKNVIFKLESLNEHRGQYDLIVSNPPYIPTTRLLPKSVRWYEDKAALYSGRDGLDMIRQLLECKDRLLQSQPGLKMIFEFDGSLKQWKEIISLHPKLKFAKDQYGQYRTAWLV